MSCSSFTLAKGYYSSMKMLALMVPNQLSQKFFSVDLILQTTLVQMGLAQMLSILDDFLILLSHEEYLLIFVMARAVFPSLSFETPTNVRHQSRMEAVPIGRGSFATVSILSGRPVAFKHVTVQERSVELKTEFQVHRASYDFCGTDSFFGIPRPLAFYDPHRATSFLSVGGSPPSESRRRPHRSLVSEGDFKLLELDTTAYAMDQVLPIPLLTAKRIRTLFYPQNTPNASDPTLCRLYFGKVIMELGPGRRPNRFFNSANFLLDVSRHRKLLEVAVDGDCVYPSVEDIVYGMGEMLGHLHWRAGYDGRDVEFIMGGASFSGVAMYIIFFFQSGMPLIIVLRWDRN
jgi:hypothetical protein